MAVYYILLLVPMIVQHFTVGSYSINYQKKNNRALAFFFIFLTVLLIFRHESVGNDTRNYIHFFEKYSALSWSEVGKEALEPGFSYLMKIISLFSKDPRFFIAVVSIAVSAMIYPTYKRLCVDSSLTIMLFCIMSTFVMMFSGIRQMLAVGVGFIAYEFTRKKKLPYFILSVCLAMSFHISAFMLFFMYPLYYAKITKKMLRIVVPALVVIFIFNAQIFTVLNVIINKFTRYEGGITSTGAFTMLLLFVIFTAFSFIVTDESKIDQETIGLRNFLLLSLVIQMFAPLHSLAMRMNYYYIIFIPLLLPNVISYRSERWKQTAVAGRYVMVAFFFVYFFFIKASSDGNLHVFPYHFFWESV